jgi:hypothetical protein
MIIDSMNNEHIKVLIERYATAPRRSDMAEAIRHGSPLSSHIEPEKPLPDVPLHKRGFGVLDKDAP